MSHRQPPTLPKKDGRCRWCGEPIEIRLKKNGEPHKVQASFHPDCYRQYWAACSPGVFWEDLIERDGKACKCCGQESPTGIYEYDHVVPLWKVADLPDEQRREYFKLTNLQRLCPPCRKRKSAREAAERAHLKRLKNPKPKKGPKLQSRGFDARYRKKMNGEVVAR